MPTYTSRIPVFCENDKLWHIDRTTDNGEHHLTPYGYADKATATLACEATA